MSKLLACTPPLSQRAQEHAISQRRERAGTRPAGAGVPGGVQIQDGTTLLGAIGVSGDTSDNDEICAIAGIETAGLKASEWGEQMTAFRETCQRSEVAFEVEGPFDRFLNCHCSRCRKASGTAHSCEVIVKASPAMASPRSVCRVFQSAAGQHPSPVRPKVREPGGDKNYRN
jgi:hypothetical protein